jgi:hypothetical protein
MKKGLKEPPFKVGDTLNPSAWNNGERKSYVKVPCIALNVVYSIKFITNYGVTVAMNDGQYRTLDSGWFNKDEQ